MSTPLWQHPLMATLEDGALRPGGLSLTQHTYSKLDITPSTQILDAGCGIGATSEFIQKSYHASVIGIDISHTNIQQTQARGVTALQGTLAQLPFHDATFHIVNCDCVLSLCNSLPAVLSEFSRVLCPSGVLVFSDLYCRKQHHAPAGASHAGCASSPLQLEAVSDALAAASFAHITSSDHTKELKELTAKLIFSGIKSCCAGNSAQQTTSYDKNIGYIQVVATKKE